MKEKEEHLVHNRIAECAVLGAIILDNAALPPALKILSVEDFSVDSHRRIFARMVALSGKSQPIDLITLSEELGRAGELEVVGGAAYVASLSDGLPRSTNIEHYARIVKEKSQLRRLAQAAHDILNRAGRSGVDADSLCRDLESQLTALRQGKAQGRGFALTRIGELLAEQLEQTAWAVDRRLPSAGFSLLAGKPKAGKSTLARCLALAVSRGECFLDWATTPGPVLYLALEEKRSEVRGHFQRMGATGDEPLFVHAAHAPQQAIDGLRRLVEQHRPVLVIVDTLQKLIRVEDGNDYSEMVSALEPLTVLARGSGAHVLAVHHLGKSDRNDAGDAILGSTALLAAVDTALLLRRTDRYRTLSSIQRYGSDLAETVLEFDPDRGLLSLGPEKVQADAQRAGEAILEFLREAVGPQGEAEIMNAVDGRQATKRRALRELVKAGSVSRNGGGRRGDPYAYQLAQTLNPTLTTVDERLAYPRTQDTVGTRVRESEKRTHPADNTEEMPAPGNPAKTILVPDKGSEPPKGSL